MHIDLDDPRVGEERGKPRLGLARPGKAGLGHHARRIEAAQGDDPRREHRRRRIREAPGRRGALADEDRVRGAIGPFPRTADMVQQQHPRARRSIGEADPAGKAGRLVGDHHHRPSRGKFGLAQREERGIGGGVEPLDQVRHRRSPFAGQT